MSDEKSNTPANDSKFKRRTSVHNLKLDVTRAAAAASGGHPPHSCPCIPPAQNVTQRFNNPSGQTGDPEVIEEGKQLFKNFVREEIRREGLLEPANCFSPLCSTPVGYHNPVWAKAGRELREMADEFNKTMERRRVREKAHQLIMKSAIARTDFWILGFHVVESSGIGEISHNQFYDLLTELFLGEGITRERILVLFFFCSDLAIRTLRQQAVNIFQRCLEWSQEYIIDRVCLWVQQQGGWAAVLHSSVKCLQQVALFFGIVAVGVFIMRWLRTSHK